MDATGCLLAAVRQENASAAELQWNLPPKTTGASRGDDIDVTRRLAAFAPRIPHVGRPCDALLSQVNPGWSEGLFKIRRLRKVRSFNQIMVGGGQSDNSRTTVGQTTATRRSSGGRLEGDGGASRGSRGLLES